MSESETTPAADQAATPAQPENVTAAGEAPAEQQATELSPETASEAAPEATPDSEASEAPSDSAPEAAPSATPSAPAPSAPAPSAPAPSAPAPGPRPGKPSPAALAGKRPAAPLIPVAPPQQEYDEADIAAALEFGSVAEDGTVNVQDGTQVRAIGSVPPAEGGDAAANTAKDHAAVLRPFAEAYLDLVAFLDLTEKKLAAPEHTQNDLNRLLENLRKRMKEPQVIGDIPALRTRASALREAAKEKIHAMEADREKAREEATARRTEFVESIEKLVATDPAQISWKQAGQTMRDMVPTWKSMQAEGVSLDRAVEDALWKRLSAARATFDRMRKKFFSELDDKHAEAARIKEDLIAQAEAMKDSTDWGPTVRAYKDLMAQWRSAPRGSRKKDDAQWARFKAAQDTFFEARNADLKASEDEQRENLKVKESLLREAEQINPDEDLEAAKEKLRSIQDRWEDAGKVPRSDMRRIEERLRGVERAVKKAEADEWRRTDPRTRARVEGASSQLHAAIAGYEEALEKARATGDPRKIAEAEAALEARKEWLAVIERSARELG